MPRTIAIGDIHGCSKALLRLISAIEPEPADRIVTLGDYVDRGPESRAVIDFLLEFRSTCELVPILGNHDEMLLEAVHGKDPDGWLRCGGLETLRSYGTEFDLEAIPGDHVEFLESCLDYLETETHIFTHANYHDSVLMSEQNDGRLRWESLSWSSPGPHCSGKRVILGHSSQKSGKILDLGHLVCIDTYCYGGGWLTALDVDSNQVWQADREGRLRDATASVP